MLRLIRATTSALARHPRSTSPILVGNRRLLHATTQSCSSPSSAFSSGNDGWQSQRPHFYMDLAPWLQERHILIHPDVAIEFSKDGGSRVVVKAPIASGEAIITVPESAVFCADNIYAQSPLAANIVREALLGYSSLSGLDRAERELFGLMELSLLAWLQHESVSIIGNDMESRQDRSWMKWLQFWPTQAATSALLTADDIRALVPQHAWDREIAERGDNARCLEDFKNVLQRTHKFVDVLSDSLEVDLRPLLDSVDASKEKNGSAVDNGAPFSEQLRDFYSVCSERAMDSCHFSILQQDDIAKRWGVAIVPAVDFVSHASEHDANSKLVVSSPGAGSGGEMSVVLRASRELIIGEHVMRDVGARTNESALLKRGFFDPNLRMGVAASCNWGHVSDFAATQGTVVADAPAFSFESSTP